MLVHFFSISPGYPRMRSSKDYTGSSPICESDFRNSPEPRSCISGNCSACIRTRFSDRSELPVQNRHRSGMCRRAPEPLVVRRSPVISGTDGKGWLRFRDLLASPPVISGRCGCSRRSFPELGGCALLAAASCLLQAGGDSSAPRAPNNPEDPEWCGGYKIESLRSFPANDW